MAKRQSRSIKPARQPRQTNARTKGQAGATHDWHDLYLIAERERDVAGLPDLATPMHAKPPLPFCEISHFAVSEPARLTALRRRMSFQNQCKAMARVLRDAERDANSPLVDGRRPVVDAGPKPEPAKAPEPFRAHPEVRIARDMLAAQKRAQAHCEWLAEQHAENAERLARKLATAA